MYQFHFTQYLTITFCFIWNPAILTLLQCVTVVPEFKHHPFNMFSRPLFLYTYCLSLPPLMIHLTFTRKVAVFPLPGQYTYTFNCWQKETLQLELPMLSILFPFTLYGHWWTKHNHLAACSFVHGVWQKLEKVVY